MDVTVSTADLLKELTLTEKLASRKPVIPVLACALLEASEAGLRVSGTDLDVGLRGLVPARVAVDGKAAVPAHRLCELVRLLPDTDLRIEGGGEGVSLTAQTGFRGRLQTQAVEDYPVLPESPPPQAELPAVALRQLIERVRFAVTHDDTRYFLAGALLEVQEHRIQMVATDGHRLARASAKYQGLPVPASIVPRRAIDALLSILETGAGVAFATTDSHLFFCADDHVLVSRRPAGDFPKWERVVPKPAAHRLELLRGPTAAVLQRAKLAVDEHTRQVVLSLTKSGLTVAASSSLGESTEHIAGTYGGDDLAVGLNIDYVLDFFTATDAETVSFEVRDGQQPAVWRQVGGDTEYEYIVMPIRL